MAAFAKGGLKTPPQVLAGVNDVVSTSNPDGKVSLKLILLAEPGLLLVSVNVITDVSFTLIWAGAAKLLLICSGMITVCGSVSEPPLKFVSPL